MVQPSFLEAFFDFELFDDFARKGLRIVYPALVSLVKFDFYTTR